MEYANDLRHKVYPNRNRSHERTQAQLMADAIASYTGPITVCRPTTSDFRAGRHHGKAALRRGVWKAQPLR